jgi:hypothetical protein
VNSVEFRSGRFDVNNSPEDLLEFVNERGWGDGLPVVPPTEERVAAMLGGLPPERSLGPVPPAQGEATLEKIAVNAVLAGCRPSYFPVVAAAVEAALDPVFNLQGVMATTHPCGVLVVVNGPAARELEIQSGSGAFGPGWRANATIGRAVRLALQNIGGARPGQLDRATQGSPAKYTWCFAESAEGHPWEPFHVWRGFAASDSTVTVCGAEGPHNVNDHASKTGAGVLTTAADTMSVMGGNHLYARGEPMIVFGPEHAAILAEEKWSRLDVQRFLFESSQKPYGKYRLGGAFGMIGLPRWVNTHDEGAGVPLAERPEDIFLLAAGGPGRHSAFVPTFGLTRAVTRRIGGGN